MEAGQPEAGASWVVGSATWASHGALRGAQAAPKARL